MEFCHYCDISFLNCRLLYQHVVESHNLLEKFECVFENCQRTYTCINSFKKHVRSKHSLTTVNQDYLLVDDSIYRDNFKNHAQCKTKNPKIYQSDSDDDECPYQSVEENEKKKNIYDNDDSLYVYPDWENNLKNACLNYTATLYNMKNTCRKLVDNIVCETANLIKTTSDILKDNILNLLKEPVSKNINDDVNKLFDQFSNCLTIVDSEQKRFYQYKKLKTFVYPESYDLGERKEYVKKNHTLTLVHVRVNAQFIPLRLVFKHFFELPGVFDETMQYMQDLYLNEKIITNLVQANYWKSRRKTFNDKLVIPLIMYFDDYENNNPLGSHKGIAKTGAVYVSIPVLPPQYQAKLENIFLFILFNSLDRQIFRNLIIFSKVVEELNYLNESGIDIELPLGTKKIFFELALIVADNLGLHSLLGLTESFRSNIFCHHCLIKQSDKHKILLEQDCIVRTVDNYNTLLETNDLQVSGIKEKCVFHAINNFHMCQNICVDVMHDLLEGVCRYDMALILNHFINVVKLFSLEELNLRLHSFDYGLKYNINKPPEINEISIKKGYIIMSSSEMLCFIQNFNLIIGSIIPNENEYWELFLTLRELITIVATTNLHPSTYNALETIVYEYLSQLNSLFPGNIKPKHHFLLHYARCMLQFGPLWKLCCLRYESKNQEGKQISRNTTSRLNINKTIAIKHQLYLNYRFMVKKESYTLFESQRSRKCECVTNSKYYVEFMHLLKGLNLEKIERVNYVDYIGKKIQKNNIIVMFSINGPEFYMVQEIIFCESKHAFITQKFHHCFFYYHIQAYKIYNDSTFSWQILYELDISNSIVTNVARLSDGYNYVCKNWF